MVQSLLEKLHFKDERNVLVQGLPVSIERHFGKINYTKSITPLLKKNKVDFAILFFVDRAQMQRLIPDVLPNLAQDVKLWIVHPKPGAKIRSDLNSYDSWEYLHQNDFHLVRRINIDHVYNASQFAQDGMEENFFFTQTVEDHAQVDPSEVPTDLRILFDEFAGAAYYFWTLCLPYQRQFLYWVESAPDSEIRRHRMQEMMERLLGGNYVLA